MVTEQYERAQALLREHRAALETLAGELLEHETLDGSAVAEALKAKPRRRRAPAAGEAAG